MTINVYLYIYTYIYIYIYTWHHMQLHIYKYIFCPLICSSWLTRIPQDLPSGWMLWAISMASRSWVMLVAKRHVFFIRLWWEKMNPTSTYINIHQHTYMVWSYESHGLWIQWRYTMMLWIPWLNPTGSNYWGFQAPRRLDPAPSHQFFCPKNGPWWCVAGAADSLKPSPLN